MQKLFCFIAITVFLASCSSAEKNTESSEAKNNLSTQSDTDPSVQQKDAAVTIDGVSHRIFYAAAPGTDQKHPAGNSTRTGKGLSFYFTLRQDTDTVWHHVFTKTDFRNFIPDMLLEDSKVKLPRFEAYLPEMKAFVFYVDFEYPNINSGQSALIIIGYNGYRVYKGALQDAGGKAVISPAQTEVLAFGDVIREDWTVRSVSDTLYHVASYALSDEYALVLLYDREEIKSNIKLISWKGQKIEALPYHGFYQEKGLLHTPMYLDSVSGNYYFLDKENDQLLVVPVAAPTQMHSLKLSEMKPLSAATEKDLFFEITVRDSLYRFSVNAQTGLYRYQKP